MKFRSFGTPRFFSFFGVILVGGTSLVCACSSSSSPSGSSGSSGADGGSGGPATSAGSSGSNGSPVTPDSGAPDHGDSGKPDPGPKCPGMTVSDSSDCVSPCDVLNFLDGSGDQGSYWCASSCQSDLDCPIAGQICDLQVGLGTDHTCVAPCIDDGECQNLGLPVCQATSPSDSRQSCF
jgi:hypothetical protein